jgi:hypothetical protein
MTASQPSIRVRWAGTIRPLVVGYRSRREDLEPLIGLLVDLFALAAAARRIRTPLPVPAASEKEQR